MLPAALHLVQRRFVSGVPGRDGFPQVDVLRLDDLIRVAAVMLELARSTQLLACHRFHTVSVEVPDGGGLLRS
jgi:hypothetical protein